MNTFGLTGLRAFRKPSRRGFTIVELLVVVGIITILAGLLLPAIIRAMDITGLQQCLNQMRQIGQAYVNYVKDFDSWMPSAGARYEGDITQGLTPPYVNNVGPFSEPPVDYDAALKACSNLEFPFWYAALAPYVNPVATWKNAVTSYCKRMNVTPAQVTDDAWYHLEVARLCMMYTCPAKKRSILGYGYNYAAPFGESILYPFNQTLYGLDYPSRSCDHLPQNAADQDKAQDEYCWPTTVTNQTGNPDNPNLVTFTGFANYPCYAQGNPCGLPILWYGQSVHASVLTDPSAQIAVCDTGLVTNDPTQEYKPGVGLVYGPGALPPEWREGTISFSGECYRGYTRFPMSRVYTGEDVAWSDKTSKKRVWWYKNLYRRCAVALSGSKDYRGDVSWRPVPRHNGKTVCMFFDGRAMPFDINDIVNYEWGDRRCLFDNRPPSKPPVPKMEVPAIFADKNSSGSGRQQANTWLPYRNTNGTVDMNH